MFCRSFRATRLLNPIYICKLEHKTPPCVKLQKFQYADFCKLGFRIPTGNDIFLFLFIKVRLAKTRTTQKGNMLLIRKQCKLLAALLNNPHCCQRADDSVFSVKNLAGKFWEFQKSEILNWQRMKLAYFGIEKLFLRHRAYRECSF